MKDLAIEPSIAFVIIGFGFLDAAFSSLLIDGLSALWLCGYRACRRG